MSASLLPLAIPGYFNIGGSHVTGETCLVVVALVIAGFQTSLAQISPGELSSAHAQLEGISNCTKCHELGKDVSNAKCLSCHAEIRSRMANQTGYHAHLVKNQCVECHKEHNGKDFQLVRFDSRSLDHATVGFSLEGKHRRIECVQCHSRDHIKAKDVLQNAALTQSKTYLGLQKECMACHADPHKGQLQGSCSLCHSSESWKPASQFSHDRARFRLTGRHQTVECARCHPSAKDDPKTMKFVDLAFANCSSCHADPHRGRFAQTCESCHTTNGWKEGSTRRFDHSLTRFPLRGRHVSVRCEQCHISSKQKGIVTQTFAIARYQGCADCHADNHGGEFNTRPGGSACESCHSEDGFVPSKFSHATSGFQLAGKHASVACAKCHPPARANGDSRVLRQFHVSRYQKCADCHEDQHGGQLTARADGGACESCHTVEGYAPSIFTAEGHRATRFPLSGSHAAVPCGKCHTGVLINGKKTPMLRWRGNVDCQTCHKDVHRGQFDKFMSNSCGTCHSTQEWRRAQFSHESTRFPLTGKHVGLRCAQCHKTLEPGTPRERVQYAGTPSRCIDCHAGNKQMSDD